MNKRGQLYFILVLIIASFVIAILSSYNSSKIRESSSVNDLGGQLKIESRNVFYYDLYNSEDKLNDFTLNFSNHAKKNTNIIYITGNPANIKAYNYSNNQINYFDSKNLTITSNKIIFDFNGINYSFKKENGENFYFIISKKNKKGDYIIAEIGRAHV